jgi:hypothetical protein
MAETLEQRVDAAVSAVLGRRLQEVERLVAARVDCELELLVDRLVEERLAEANGDAEEPTQEDELEAWLLGAGFAVKNGELLRPTPAAIDVGELLTV